MSQPLKLNNLKTEINLLKKIISKSQDMILLLSFKIIYQNH